MAERQRVHVDAHLILRRGDEILLGQRQNTGWCDGYWHLPAGHSEGQESMVEYAAQANAHYVTGEPYSERGWQE